MTTFVRCICCGGPIYADSVILLDADTYDYVGVWCRRAECGERGSVDEHTQHLYSPGRALGRTRA